MKPATHNTTCRIPRPSWIATMMLLTFGGLRVAAQDIHFSQIDVNPILYNPAYSGFFDGSGRFGVAYRNQWASVGEAFQTVAATAEYSLVRRRRHHDGFNIGAFLYSDRAGALRYGTTSGSAVLSYYRAVGSHSDNLVSLAVEAGYGQAGFDPSDARLMDETETFEQNAVSYPLIGAGVAFFSQPNDDFYIKAGLSARNLNRPNISYLGLDDTYLERKFNGYLRAEYRAWADVAVQPLLACQFQKNYSEFIVGADAKWYISESSFEQISFSGGLHYRVLDALYTEFTLEYNAFLFALSYDANLSKLTPASKSLGAFELGIVYRLSNRTQVRRKAMPCPII